MTDRDVLIRRILEVQRRLRRQFTEDDSHPLLNVNLTMSQLKVLIILNHLGGASGQELARRTGFGLATLTGIVDRLIAQDIVSRGEDPRDRRVRRIELTPTGTALIDRLTTAGEEHHRRMLRHLDGHDLELVADAFDLLLNAATTCFDDDHRPAPPTVGLDQPDEPACGHGRDPAPDHCRGHAGAG